METNGGGPCWPYMYRDRHSSEEGFDGQAAARQEHMGEHPPADAAGPRYTMREREAEAVNPDQPPVIDPAARPWRKRLLNRRSGALFVRNAIASTISFLFDLAVIWLLVEQAGANRFLAVIAGFIAANFVHYLLARIWIFRESLRGLMAGYALFFANALVGLGVILAGFALLTEVAGVPFLPARILASLIAGTLVFVLNATINFRQL